jgi:hypothetical protein
MAPGIHNQEIKNKMSSIYEMERRTDLSLYLLIIA